MLKPLVLASVLFTSGIVAVNTNAANMIYDDSVFLAGGENFPPSPILTWLAVDSADLSALPQFDASIGVLTSVTLSIVGELEYGTDVYGREVVDEGTSNSITANGVVAITAEVPVDGGTAVRPFTTIASDVTCSEGPNSGVCWGFVADTGSIDISGTFTGTEMAAFLGDDSLTAMDIKLFVAMNSLTSVNVVDAKASIFADFSGDVIVNYEYTLAPVPLPAAAWMFGSGLLGLLGVKKIRRA